MNEGVNVHMQAQLCELIIAKRMQPKPTYQTINHLLTEFELQLNDGWWACCFLCDVARY